MRVKLPVVLDMPDRASDEDVERLRAELEAVANKYGQAISVTPELVAQVPTAVPSGG
jgi:hypothetical protein